MGISVFLLALISMFLSVWGIRWGLPSVDSWAPDTIAGTRTLRTIGTWPDRWPTHYPPLNFFVNQLAYQAQLGAWQRTGDLRWVRLPSGGRKQSAPALPGEPGAFPLFSRPVEQIGALILTSRCITAAMSLATVLIVAACGVRLFDDWWIGVLAGLTLATCAEWVFFSHLGNLDIPYMFWFALSLYIAIRVLQTDAWRHYVLLGVFASLAVATKDAVIGAYVGVAVMVLVKRVRRAGECAEVGRSILRPVLHGKTWVALASFVLPYATINGLWTNPKVYVHRLAYYLAGPGTSNVNQSYAGPVWLVREAVAEAARALGWPMLCVMIVAVAFGLVRYRRATLFALVPSVSYYLVVCSTTGIAFARVLFPIFICLSLVVGRFCVSWLRSSRVPIVVRYGSTCLLFLLSFGYCLAVDLEMRNDTRHRAEAWLAGHVEPDETIGVFSPPQYLPRFFVAQRRAKLLEMTPEALRQSASQFVLLTSHNFEDFDEKQDACFDALLAGNLGYKAEPAVEFHPVYLPPQRHVLALAGWGTRGAGKVSPHIIILERKDN